MGINLIRLIAFILLVTVFMPGMVHAEAVEGNKDSEYTSSKLLVKFYPEATDEKKTAIREELGAELVKCLNEISAEVWTLPEGRSMDDTVMKLRQETSVEYSRPDYIYIPQSSSSGDKLNGAR